MLGSGEEREVEGLIFMRNIAGRGRRSGEEMGVKGDREERWRERMYLITGEWEGDILTKRF